MTNEEKINLIGQKILLLSNNLEKYKAELDSLQQQLNLLKGQQQKDNTSYMPPVVKEVVITPDSQPVVLPIIETPLTENKATVQIAEETSISVSSNIPAAKPASKFNFEEFVGARLINIIGIIVLIIGMGIGVKYAIDNDLLGPLARIVLAYFAGAIMLGIAFKLKEKLKTFSAILLSGAMASLYFTTYVAFDLYHMFPQLVAFGLMFVFTAFTVYSATIYALEVIGIIGLVGAYAVPLLLSDGSGKIAVMFTYTAIINLGILVLSFKKIWRVLHYFAFAFTWLIVFTWFITKYNYQQHFAMLMFFSFLFFVIFYLNNLAYKIIKKESLGAMDIVGVMSNSFAYFGLGYAALNNDSYKQYMGLYALINSVLHLIAAAILVNRNKITSKAIDNRLFYLLMVLVLSFFTIAIPVQLDGNWVTLLWGAEAVLLFVIGRYKGIRFYELLSFLLVILAAGSWLQDWGGNYHFYSDEFSETPFFNNFVFTSLFLTAVLIVINFFHHKKVDTEPTKEWSIVYRLMEYLLPIVGVFIAYQTFSSEISVFFQTKYQQSFIKVPSTVSWAEPGAMVEEYDFGWLTLGKVVSFMYNIAFFSILTAIIKKIRSNEFAKWTILVVNLIVAAVFLTGGLFCINNLRDYYLSFENAQYFHSSVFLVYIRYLCFVLFGILLYVTNRLLKGAPFTVKLSKAFSGVLVHLFIIVILSIELLHQSFMMSYNIADVYHSIPAAAYKIGLTVLWGIYSFILIAVGIFKKRKSIRITAISIFGVTLLKLMVFDTWSLSTGYKIIAYILLGVILLVVAFLYQKFKHIIFDDEKHDVSEQIEQ